MKKEIKNLLSLSLGKVPDKPYCKLTFLLKNKRFPNLKEPKLFNDKLLALKLFSERDSTYKKLVDKFDVREYIEKTIGSEYLIPLIGLYSDPSEVDFDSLPNKFVLKLTSGSQNNLICINKNTLDWIETSKKIKKWLSIDPYIRTREWQYKDLPKRFVIEEYISDSQGNTNDYKFWCFHGNPYMVQIDSDRMSDNHERSFFDVKNFERIDVKMGYNDPKTSPKKPKNFDKMVDLATQLSKNLKFARIDLYNLDGKIYFGEITFHPGNCNRRITPIEYERILGDKLNIV